MALISVFLLGNAEPAGAVFFTASELKEKLESTNSSDNLIAMSYITGAFDGFDYGVAVEQFRNTQNKRLVYVCLPAGATLDQIVAVVKKYILDNPKDWQTQAATQVMSALQKAWPCKK